jgi:hypothetical protein
VTGIDDSVVNVRCAVGADDAPQLIGLLSPLGYPSEPDAVTTRLASVLSSPTRQVLITVDDSRIDGYWIEGFIGLERRMTLHQGRTRRDH